MAYEPLSAQQYRQAIIAYLTARGSGLTNFKPGSRIGTFVEAIALEMAASDYEYLRAYREGIREACFDAFNFSLQPGERATGQVRVFNTDPPQAIEIPQFTITLFGLVFTSGEDPPALRIDTPHVDVNISAQSFGSEYNLPDGSIDSDLGQGVIEPRFDSGQVTNLTPISGGTDQESETDRELRFQAFIQNLARVTIGGIEATTRNFPGVVEVFVDENINPVSNQAEYGWVNVYVSDGTAETPQSFLDDVSDYLQGRSELNNFTESIAAGTRLFVGSIEILAVNLSVGLSIDETSSLSDNEITQNVENAIREYVNRLSAGQDVLLDHIKSAAIEEYRQDIIYVSITTPLIDVVVANRQLPRIGGAGGGTITISITRVARP